MNPPTATATSFSAALANATRTAHSGAEHSPFMAALMGKTLPMAGYVDLLVQYLHVYRALEDGAAALADDPVVAPFLSSALNRVPALEADIADLTARPEVSGMTFAPTEAAVRYADRIREVSASSPGRYVAHHYTRYLGDLSGGFAIGRLVGAAYGLSPEDGGRFAIFDAIDDPAAFKNAYRSSLDAAPWSPDQQDEVVAEVLDAYRFNVELFASLDHHGA